MHVLAAIGALALLLAGAQPALAHPGHLHRALQWSWDPLILGSIGIAGLLYAAGAVRLWSRLGGARLPRWRDTAAYAAGLLTLFMALISPIDSIAEQLFWVHMVQHLLLLLVAAPLLVMGRPAVAVLWAFGPQGRKRIGATWRGLGLHGGVAFLMHPSLVWLLFCGAFIFWHFPAPYQWALRDETVHTIEHLSFLLTALMFWSLVIEPSGRRRLGYGATLVFVMTAAILSGLPGALIALAPRPLYPAHAEGVAAWGLTLLQDQQLAGIVMWIPGGVVYLIAAAWVFLRWLGEDEIRRGAVILPGLVLALPLLLGGCGDDAEGSANLVGKPKHGAELVRIYGCGACHDLPGIENANGTVGPPLGNVGRRLYLAGVLRNTPDNMVAWLRDPQRFVPGNIMPNLHLSDADARDIAAFLYRTSRHE